MGKNLPFLSALEYFTQLAMDNNKIWHEWIICIVSKSSEWEIMKWKVKNKNLHEVSKEYIWNLRVRKLILLKLLMLTYLLKIF